MKVITESLLRSEFKKEIPEVYVVEKESIITPSAKQFLRDKKIEAIYEKDSGKTEKNQKVKKVEIKSECVEFKEIKEEFKPKFISNYDGGMYDTKPEYMTHIFGNKLVFKDDSKIIFRGKVDSLQSKILKTQLKLSEAGEEKIVQELEDVLNLFREISRVEVLEKNLEKCMLFGLPFDEIQKHSHNPKKHYGISHLSLSIKMGMVLVELNSLRTEIREVELHAMKAFRSGTNVDRKDIITALNRASSGIYVLMCRCNSQYYEKNKR